jgi:hypothetical protein
VSAEVSILARCGRSVIDATDGRTVRGARERAINSLLREGVQKDKDTRMTLAMVRVAEHIGAVARGAR